MDKRVKKISGSFIAVLTAVCIALCGCLVNRQNVPLQNGGTLTDTMTAAGVRLYGWKQLEDNLWSFSIRAEPGLGELILCRTGDARFTADSDIAPDDLAAQPETMQLVSSQDGTLSLFALCTREPQCWVMSPLCAQTGNAMRALLQMVSLAFFATLAATILALYHYKKQPELRYFLLYLAVLFVWGAIVACFPSGLQGWLQRCLRLFFAVMILASALLSAVLLSLPCSARWVVPLSAAFLVLSFFAPSILRFSTLTAGMSFCLYLLILAYYSDYEAAGLLLFPCAVTTGLRVWALLPNLSIYPECYTLYLLRCSRLFDIPFALGCMTFVCRRFALQFDRTEQLARELDTRVIERTKALTEETEARKSMMLNIFHDLRSPLFAVSCGLESLANAPEALPALLPTLQQRIDFVRRMTEDLFLAAKLEQKQVMLNEDRVELGGVAALVCDACQSEASRKGVLLKFTACAKLPVWGDETRLEQIIQNLVTNAIHYTPSAGDITVSAYAENGTACVCVADTGCGIAKEDQPAVFDRYFHTTASNKHDSTGLGLTIAQELAHLHHGEITLTSEVGNGSRFTLCLPLLEQPQADPS